MKVETTDEAMNAMKDCMARLEISDTHDNRIKFANLCMQVGAAQLLAGHLFVQETQEKFPAQFEGYAQSVPARPDRCSDCEMPVVKGGDGKFRCNCRLWDD